MADLSRAEELGREYVGKEVDLDEGIPFDIYDLFARVTGRDYNRSHEDEVAILEYASAFEKASLPKVSFAELVNMVDPAKAQTAIANAMIALGSEAEWDSETIEHVCEALGPAFPEGLPSVFNQDYRAVSFWEGM